MTRGKIIHSLADVTGIAEEKLTQQFSKTAFINKKQYCVFQRVHLVIRCNYYNYWVLHDNE